MKKLFSLTLLLVVLATAARAINPIVGPSGICIGGTTGYIDSTAGGTWSSSDPAVATIDVSTGLLTSVSVGTTVITYATTLGYDVKLITITNVPDPITGTTIVCSGATTTLADATPGGTGASWMSSDPSIADVYSGAVTGSLAGTATISYMPTSAASGCVATTVVTVNVTPTGYITGDSFVCVGSSTLLADAVSGGVWSSGDLSIATVDASGNVTGVSAGWTYISYTITAGCGPASATFYMNVEGSTSAGTITGIPSTLYPGGMGWLYATGAVGAGSWSSSDPSVATIDAYGDLTGVAVGTAIITYTSTGCTGSATTTATVTVIAESHIAGTVNFPSSTYHGGVKVWLITYNPTTFDLEAVDSSLVYASGGTVDYVFYGVGTDSFRVKAAIDTEYATFMEALPTYHTSSYYWHDADVIYHVAGTNTDGVDINMMAGMTTSGPGFIAGNVTTGANKGTSGAVPVAGMKLYAVNTTTSTVVQVTATDATGAYSLNSLPYGTYMIFPDSLNYLTTPMTGITLSAANPSFSGAGFVQHTISHTITPIPLAVTSVAAMQDVVFVYPNPAKESVRISWSVANEEQATILLSDVTGRTVYSGTTTLTTGAGSRKLDVSAMPSGIYIITVQSASLNYTAKLEVKH